MSLEVESDGTLNLTTFGVFGKFSETEGFDNSIPQTQFRVELSCGDLMKIFPPAGTHNDTLHRISWPYIRIIFSLFNGKRRKRNKV